MSNTQLFIRNAAKGAMDWRHWLYGLMSGTIGGIASAGSAWLGLAAAKASGADVHTLNWRELGIVCLSSGIVAAFAFLKQSPLPKWDDVSEVDNPPPSDKTGTP